MLARNTRGRWPWAACQASLAARRSSNGSANGCGASGGMTVGSVWKPRARASWPMDAPCRGRVDGRRDSLAGRGGYGEQVAGLPRRDRSRSRPAAAARRVIRSGAGRTSRRLADVREFADAGDALLAAGEILGPRGERRVDLLRRPSRSWIARSMPAAGARPLGKCPTPCPATWSVSQSRYQLPPGGSMTRCRWASSWRTRTVLRAMRRLRASGRPAAASNGTEVIASAPPIPAAKQADRVS